MIAGSAAVPVALSDVLVGPHGLRIGPVEASSHLLERGRHTRDLFELDGHDVVIIPDPRAVGVGPPMVRPCHTQVTWMVELRLDVLAELFDGAAKILEARSVFVGLERVVHAAGDQTL